MCGAFAYCGTRRHPPWEGGGKSLCRPQCPRKPWTSLNPSRCKGSGRPAYLCGWQVRGLDTGCLGVLGSKRLGPGWGRAGHGGLVVGVCRPWTVGRNDQPERSTLRQGGHRLATGQGSPPSTHRGYDGGAKGHRPEATHHAPRQMNVTMRSPKGEIATAAVEMIDGQRERIRQLEQQQAVLWALAGTLAVLLLGV